MKRTRLFFKIYLGFWLTIIVTGGAFFYLERLIITKPMMTEWNKTLGKTVQFYAEESTAIFVREGARALKTYFLRLEQATGIQAFMFDEKGVEVTGNTVRRELLDQISLSVENAENDDPNYIRTDEEGIASRKITISPEKTVVFVVLFPHPEPPELGPKHHADRKHGPPPNVAPPKPPPLEYNFLPHPGMPPHIFPPNFLIRLSVWLIVSAIICYLLARYLTTPIFKLGHAARQLADGNLSVRVSPTLGRRRDELSFLAHDFDGMAERIEKLLTSQSHLLRDVSHELRSPLARLNVALELCRQNLSPDEEKHLDRIALETERLNDLIGQILAYNKINAPSANIQKTKFELSVLIEEVVADANYEARDSRVMIKSNEPFLIEGNYDYLRRAVENIVRNALYHTPKTSLVDVSTEATVRAGKPSVLIMVRDHGKGVPEDALPLIFTPFFKIASTDQHKTGAGLGLAISEAAIRLHDGDIKAVNASDGGLIVEIVLPEANSF